MATPDPTPSTTPTPAAKTSGATFKSKGKPCLVSGGVSALVGTVAGPPGVVAGFADGCIAGAGLEATAEYADSLGYPDVANVLRLGGAFNDVASLFG